MFSLYSDTFGKNRGFFGKDSLHLAYALVEWHPENAYAPALYAASIEKLSFVIPVKAANTR